ncbi:hypothetical protein DW083_03260 [Parabacteroides sp. AF48-14]|nr:hypothetical protein DW083_03260 [Parabacteroides sp. AF48-14]
MVNLLLTFIQRTGKEKYSQEKPLFFKILASTTETKVSTVETKVSAEETKISADETKVPQA